MSARELTAVLLLDTNAGSKIGELTAPTKSARDLSLSVDGKHLGARSDDGLEIYVWDVGAPPAARVVKRKNKPEGTRGVPRW